MPLTARLRDEENERINNILKRLLAFHYVPEHGNHAIDDLLSGLGFNMQTLFIMTPENIVLHLQKLDFDWANAEQLGDFIMSLAGRLPENTLALREKAVAVYNFIQLESKTFSFNISNKIAAAKK